MAQDAVNTLPSNGWNISFATFAQERNLRQRCVLVSNLHYRANVDSVREDIYDNEKGVVDYVFNIFGPRGFTGRAIVACCTSAAADCFADRYQNMFFHGRHLRVHRDSFADN